MYLDLVDSLSAQGRSCFTYQEFLNLAGSSEIAVKSALHRLQKKGEIAMPFRGFFVILLSMYRIVGVFPRPSSSRTSRSIWGRSITPGS